MQALAKYSSKKNLLLCFDAFGTLFAPQGSIATQYAHVARQHGLKSFTESELEDSFKKAFKEQNRVFPIYGRAAGMKAPEWWGNVIVETFSPFCNRASAKDMVPTLLARFSSKEGYRLFPDVRPFLQMLQAGSQGCTSRKTGRWDSIIVGVITNSDDRVSDVLRSLGMTVSLRRYGLDDQVNYDMKATPDVSFVVTSYDVGYEKPDGRIFAAAEQLCIDRSPHSNLSIEDFEKLYVGDELQRDVLGAKAAGWHSVLISRQPPNSAEEIEGDVKEGREKRKERVIGADHVDIIRGFDELNTWKPRCMVKE